MRTDSIDRATQLILYKMRSRPLERLQIAKRLLDGKLTLSVVNELPPIKGNRIPPMVTIIGRGKLYFTEKGKFYFDDRAERWYKVA